ncbi:MAG: MaoC family dehydratase N-terminal domain-containing protein [Gammaproteobacteria bacterium]|nr:MaoC family dehydratase N-terminal domain-containing protein [Gammaproteobacteria bacterium]
MEYLSNFTFDELEVGQTAQFSETLEERHLILFAAVSGDVNPVHLDEEFAQGTQFKGRIAHGMWSASLISAAIATQMPGPGSIYLGQNLSFKRPVKLGDTLTVNLTINEKIDRKKQVVIDCIVKNQSGKVVLSGDARVVAPEEKVELKAPQLPNITLS